MCTAQTTKRNNNIANLYETLNQYPMMEVANFDLPKELLPPIFEYYKPKVRPTLTRQLVKSIRGLDLPPFVIEFNSSESFDLADIAISDTWKRPLIALQLWLNGFKSPYVDSVKLSNDLVSGYNCTNIGSCMSGDGENFVSLSGTENVYIATSDTLDFRCLVWLENAQKIAFIDRVYYYSEKKLPDIYLSLLEVLTSKYEGYDIRVKNHHHECNCYKIQGNYFELAHIDALTEGLKYTFDIKGKYMPYMDTFCKLTRNKSFDKFWLTAKKGRFTLHETNGKISATDYLSNGYDAETDICDCCGCRGYLDDLIYSNYAGVYYCENCAVYCEDIGDYTYSGNTVWLEYRDCFMLTINCTEVADRYIRERIGAYIANEDLYL